MKENVVFIDKTELFENASIPHAVAELAIPTVISQIITIVYNLADTFFVGQTNDPNQVAAVSICLPAFLGLTSLANLFGIGGASLMSRSFGIKDTETARKTSTFCIYAGISFTILYSAILYLFHKQLLYMFGASNLDFYYSYQYLFWVVIIGGLPIVLNYTLSHLIRSEGYARQASIGLSLGGILNVILDPIFILPFGLNMGVKGAAIATMLSNVIASLYFLIYLFCKKNKSVISFLSKDFTFDRNIISEVLLVGLPGCLMTLMASISNVLVNKLVSVHNETALAVIKIIPLYGVTWATPVADSITGLTAIIFYIRFIHNQRRNIKK